MTAGNQSVKSPVCSRFCVTTKFTSSSSRVATGTPITDAQVPRPQASNLPAPQPVPVGQQWHGGVLQGDGQPRPLTRDQAAHTSTSENLPHAGRLGAQRLSPPLLVSAQVVIPESCPASGFTLSAVRACLRFSPSPSVPPPACANKINKFLVQCSQLSDLLPC